MPFIEIVILCHCGLHHSLWLSWKLLQVQLALKTRFPIFSKYFTYFFVEKVSTSQLRDQNLLTLLCNCIKLRDASLFTWDTNSANFDFWQQMVAIFTRWRLLSPPFHKYNQTTFPVRNLVLPQTLIKYCFTVFLLKEWCYLLQSWWEEYFREISTSFSLWWFLLPDFNAVNCMLLLSFYFLCFLSLKNYGFKRISTAIG